MNNPVDQIKLYEHQRIFNEIVNLFISKKLPNKILLSGSKGCGKATLSYHFINYAFSINEKNPYNIKTNEINIENASFKLIRNGSHPNFHLIDLMDDKKNIEISQTREMINYINKSSFNEKPKIILIDNVENLNKNSLNSLLKVIEEPNINVYFILIHDSNKKLFDTLRSRCLLFKVNQSYEQKIDITNKLLNDNLHDLVSDDFINYYFAPGDYIKLIDFSKECKIDLTKFNLAQFLNFLIIEKHYKKNDFIKSFIFILIELYFFKIIKSAINKKNAINLYSKFIYKINDTLKFNLDHETLFLEFKSKILNE